LEKNVKYLHHGRGKEISHALIRMNAGRMLEIKKEIIDLLQACTNTRLGSNRLVKLSLSVQEDKG
jgi:hypothetical protein